MKLVIIDDNQAVLSTLKILLAKEFSRIVTMSNPQVLPALLAAGDVDAVLLDMNFDNRRLDGSDGIFWLERIKSFPGAPAVVMITAFGDVPLAVEAMKRGADDFITKPWNNEELIAKLHRAIAGNSRRKAQSALLDDAASLKSRTDMEDGMTLDEMKSAHIRRIVEQCGGNLSKAAERLGINRQTLYNQLKKDNRQ